MKFINFPSALASIAALMTSLTLVHAEDIELYVHSLDDRAGEAPQVMIIFDNSGSMRSTERVKKPYDPLENYSGKYGKGSKEQVLFSVGTSGVEELPEPTGNSRRFNAEINACYQARVALYGLWKHKSNNNTKLGDELSNSDKNNYTKLIEGGQGFYVDKVAEYDKNTWVSLKQNNGLNTNSIVDCRGDILARNQTSIEVSQGSRSETLGYGLPVDNYRPVLSSDGELGDYASHYYVSNTNKIEENAIYQAYKSSFSNISTVTLYSPNYLNWKTADTNSSNTTNRTRLDIAKDAITTVISATSTVDFGLALFNYNTSSYNDGGRIVSKVASRSESETRTLLNTIDDIKAQTNTPLCETMYEVYRYYGAKSVFHGNENRSTYGSGSNYILPGKDWSAEKNDNYISPFDGACRDEAYVILITDGAPTQDSADNYYISSLPGAKTSLRVNNNYLPVLTEWMYTHDVNDKKDGTQKVVTYTIGFSSGASSAVPILTAAANNAGGQYFPATDPDELSSALQKALISILEESASFTSPSVAANNFDRTESLDNVYFSMFYPSEGSRWGGNLKKLKVQEGQIVDSNGNLAINSGGNISSSAYTYWGGSKICDSGNQCADGNDVDRGGVSEYLQLINVASRNLYIDLSGQLTKLDPDKVASKVVSILEDTASDVIDLIDDTSSNTTTEIKSLLNWAIGYDTLDEDRDGKTNDARPDIFGDPLHSKPAVINYGGDNANEQDIRVVIGTNQGFLHMFNDKGDTVEESWAFSPNSLLKNIFSLRQNSAETGKIYGMDGSPIVYVKDQDGHVKESQDDKVWLFTGMRRGGDQYYALDVTNPDSPKLKWVLDGGTSEFPTLGQSWSQPQVVYIDMKDHDSSVPVLIFAAGYVSDTDDTGLTDLGRGIYIVNADTGKRLWSFTPKAGLNKNTFANILDAMPAKVGVLDSDFDGFVDRIYATDLGGNVWRMDLAGSDPENWSIFKLASLRGSGEAAQRHFFNEPAIVRTFYKQKKSVSIEGQENSQVVVSKEIPYEGIVLGSGNRAKPNATNINDQLYVIQDRNIVTQSFKTAPSWSNIKLSDLYDMTDDPVAAAVKNGTLESLMVNELATSKGWYVNLKNSGEKSLSSARVIGGVAYFTSYTPPGSEVLTNSCSAKSGGGALYALDLSFGTQIYDWRTLDIGNRIPDTPVVFAGKNEDGESLLSFVGVGQGEGASGIIKARGSSGEPGEGCNVEGDCEVSFGLRTYKLHSKVTEE
ncbi:pilus assembly protein [Gayadomonas joobiniege]|uniref:pilus assembly protein n=1 Tax=Gayadomonas joobiniege TaxID=1234606 RepID=UPI00037009B4|nr:PilC/PilY family type IV pilus protein [Gayadomonas joobiniege]